MDIFSEAFLTIFFQLVPGFIASWVFYGLTPIPKPDQLDRIVNALIYSVIIKLIVLGLSFFFFFVGSHFFVLGTWNENVELVHSVICAFVFGLFLIVSSTYDIVHGWLRRIKLTKSDSFPSQWYEEFIKRANKDYFVVLNLKDRRRIYGIVKEPAETNRVGHFVLSPYIWLDDDKPVDEDYRNWRNQGSILIAAGDIEFVEIEDT